MMTDAIGLGAIGLGAIGMAGLRTRVNEALIILPRFAGEDNELEPFINPASKA
jgi:hypothetical protein